MTGCFFSLTAVALRVLVVFKRTGEAKVSLLLFLYSWSRAGVARPKPPKDSKSRVVLFCCVFMVFTAFLEGSFGFCLGLLCGYGFYSVFGEWPAGRVAEVV